MSHRVEIIIGSHNVTGERQIDVITEIVAGYVPAFSCWVGFGVWQGAREASTKVEVFCADIEWVARCVNELLEGWSRMQ